MEDLTMVVQRQNRVHGHGPLTLFGEIRWKGKPTSFRHGRYSLDPWDKKS